MEEDDNKKHNLTKRGLQVIGFIILAAGLTCTLVGSIVFFSMLINDGEFSPLFILLVIGLPMLSIGIAFLLFGFRREISSYVKNETVPVLNEAGEELSPAAETLSKALKEGAADTLCCPGCGAENSAKLQFCEQCGTALTKTCPACGQTVSAQARFCGHCGANLKE